MAELQLVDLLPAALLIVHGGPRHPARGAGGPNVGAGAVGAPFDAALGGVENRKKSGKLTKLRSQTLGRSFRIMKCLYWNLEAFHIPISLQPSRVEMASLYEGTRHVSAGEFYEYPRWHLPLTWYVQP